MYNLVFHFLSFFLIFVSKFQNRFIDHFHFGIIRFYQEKEILIFILVFFFFLITIGFSFDGKLFFHTFFFCFSSRYFHQDIVYGVVAGFGITAGAHRLWAHKSYSAKTPLRIFLAYLYCMAGQVS